jgi:ubiquinone/menaquinone biosynthesis C-methylase UbiE
MDRWAAGDAYEAYMGRWSRNMGRWSRKLARAFVAWLAPDPGAHWLEVGCGTGALTAAIVELSRPASVVACDPSAPFVEHARRRCPESCSFHVTSLADSLPRRDGGFDLVVSSLALNFVPDTERALTILRDRAHPGGTVAACVWDYDGGLEFLARFWEAVIELDPAAAELDESRRFRAWTQPALRSWFERAGLTQVTTDVIEIVTGFANFDDFWRPFLGNSGPAPSYVTSLDDERRERLRARLERSLPQESIELGARAFVARGVAS